MDNNELTHHGVTGMKWGVRRYQNKDGSLKPAGKKRYGDDSERKGFFKKKKQQKEEQAKPKKKSVSEMSDEELIKAINRARLEDAYSSLRPEPISKGKAFANSLSNDVIKPAAKNAGKRFAENALNKLGDKLLKDEDSVAALRKEYEKLDLQKKINKIKAGDDLSWEDKLRKQKWENEERKRKKDAEEEVNKKSAEEDSKKSESNRSTRKSAEEASETLIDSVYNPKTKSYEVKKATKYVENVVNTMSSTKAVDYITDSVSSGKISSGMNFIAGLLPPGRDD